MLLYGSMMFSQNEFEYIYEGGESNPTKVIYFSDVFEMDNGDFIVYGRKTPYNYFGRFSNSGVLLAETLINDSIPGYYNYYGLSRCEHIIKDEDGGFYFFTNKNPILDTNDINFQGYFEAKIVMKKLDENLEVVYSKEMTIPLDTTGIWDESISLKSYPEIEIGTVLDEGDGFVICYEKYTGHQQFVIDPHAHGADSTFIIKTDYDLNIQKSGSFAHDYCNKLIHRNHLLYDEEDDEYLYYVSGGWRDPLYYLNGFYLYRFDSDFNFIEEHYMANTDGTGFHTIDYRDSESVTSGITFKRTSSNTTIMMAGANCAHFINGNPPTNETYSVAICLEMDDEAKMLDSITFARDDFDYPINANYTTVPNYGSIDWVDENRIFIGATPNLYFSTMLSDYQYFVIRMINKDLNVLDELYYDLGETSALWTTILKATEDGGCMIAGHYMDFVNDPFTYYNFIKKFPPEAFDNIEEAHAHNLKLAVAYPNPGGDVMNIRTGLRNATLSVYDMQGRKVHEQEITDEVTSIDASKWENGTYVWKLGIRNEELGMKCVESGKWVK